MIIVSISVILFITISSNSSSNIETERTNLGFDNNNRQLTNLTKYNSIFKNSKNVHLYVSPQGNNNYPGNKDMPLADLQHAIDVIAAIKKSKPNQNKKFVITLLEGNYQLANSISINKEFSGLPDLPVIIEGDSAQMITISGDQHISSKFISRLNSNDSVWYKIKNELRDKVWVIDLYNLGIVNTGLSTIRGFGIPLSPSPVELLVNDNPMIPARWPNDSFATVDSIHAAQKFQCDSAPLANWTTESNAWTLGFWRWGWADFHLPLKQINKNNKTITIDECPVKNHSITKGSQWYIYNLLAELDLPGEYYIDAHKYQIYFIPPDNADVKNMSISISLFGNKNESLLKIDSASYIQIRNIEFKNTRSSAITINSASNISIENCQIRNTGTYGISVHGYNCNLNHVNISNTGAFGIKVLGGNQKNLVNSNNRIENCRIHNTGRINLTYQPPVHLEGVGHTIKNCEIYNTPSIGILFFGNYHTIEYNNIHNVCRKVDDSGAIYCGRDWALRGNVIRHNFIHHMPGDKFVKRRKGIHAIYLDDCASGITVYGNIIYKVRSYGIMNGGGRDNIIHNNIIVGCKYGHASDTRGRLKKFNDLMYSRLKRLNYRKHPWKTQFPKLALMSKRKTFLNRILFVESWTNRFPKLCEFLNIKYHNDNLPQGSTFVNNIGWNNYKWLVDTRYGKGEKPGAFTYYSISDNIEDQDPLFVDEENLNLQLRKDSPAYTLKGFNRIPFENIGIQLPLHE